MLNSATYEMRVDFSDGFEVVKVEAESIDRAKEIALAQNMDAISAMCLCRVSQEPQTFLAW